MTELVVSELIAALRGRNPSVKGYLGNEDDDVTDQEVAEALESNHCVEELQLNLNQSNKKTWPQLCRAIASLRQLRTIGLCGFGQGHDAYPPDVLEGFLTAIQKNANVQNASIRHFAQLPVRPLLPLFLNVATTVNKISLDRCGWYQPPRPETTTSDSSCSSIQVSCGKINHLVVSSNPDFVFRDVFEAAAGSSIRTLELHEPFLDVQASNYRNFSPETAASAGHFFESTRIQSLSLSSITVTAGTTAFLRGLETNTSITELTLDGCAFDKSCEKILVNVLVALPLEKLSLSGLWGSFLNDTLRQLLRPESTLRSLTFGGQSSYDDVHQYGFETLAEFLKMTESSPLEHVGLGTIHTTQDIRELVCGISELRVLSLAFGCRHFNLQEDFLWEYKELKQDMLDALQSNDTITKLDISVEDYQCDYERHFFDESECKILDDVFLRNKNRLSG